jgi:hypothetical protein
MSLHRPLQEKGRLQKNLMEVFQQSSGTASRRAILLHGKMNGMTDRSASSFGLPMTLSGLLHPSGSQWRGKGMFAQIMNLE